MGRSGKLICINDHVIRELLNDSNYEIRADGTIWTRITRTGKVSVRNVWRLSGSCRRGYCTVRYKNTMLQAHRIIYAKFKGSLESDLVINHIDGNGCNNDPENLELVTQSRNNFHRFRDLKYPPIMGNKVLNWEKIREIRLLSQNGVSYRDIKSKYNISKGHISQIIRNEIWIEGKVYHE